MKKNLQKLLAIVMAFAMVLGMAACGNSNAPATDAPATEAGKVEDNTPADTTPAEEKVVLKVHFFENATGDVWFQTLKAGFEDKYPNVTVELKGDAEITQKMGPMLEANDVENLPDVAFVLNTSWQIWADKGYLADLTDLYEGQCWEGDAAFKDTMNSGAQSYSMYRGKATIIPWSDGVLGLAYNKGMFEEHGWEVPTTWTELLALCEEIKAAGIAPFTYPGQIMGYWDFVVQNMIASYGGMEYHNEYLAMETIEPWKNERGLFRDSSESAHYATGVNALALCYDLFESTETDTAVSHLENTPWESSTLLTLNVLQALFRNGRTEAAYRMLTADKERGWGVMIKKGYGTMWEGFSDIESHSHAWNAYPARIFAEYLVGIRCAESGFTRVELKPCFPAELNHLSATVNTPQGKLTVKWDRSEFGMKLHLNIPFGIKVDVYEPGDKGGYVYRLTALPGRHQIVMAV